MMRALTAITLITLTACPRPDLNDNQPTSVLYRMGIKDGVEMCKQSMPDGGLSDMFPCPRIIYLRLIG